MSPLLALLCPFAWAQDDVVPVPEGEVQQEPRRGPDRRSYEALGELQRLYEQEAQGRRASEEEIDALRQELRKANLKADRPSTDGGSGEADSTTGAGALARPVDESGKATIPNQSEGVKADAATFLKGLKKRPRVGDKVGATPVPSGPQPMVFDVPDAGAKKVLVLPAGSYVKTRILTGVEADDRTLIPMTLQADYAAVGPNGTQVDLTGCMLIAQVKGQLSTDRVVGKAVRLSCVRENGELADVEIDGYLTGEDSTLGIVGKLISRQGRVLAAATVANLAKGAGEAVAAANTTTNLISNPITGPTGEVAQNVTGDVVAYTAGSSVAEAAEDIADWYLDYAKKLTPAIAVGSGRDVWVVLLEPVKFPGLK